MSSAPATLTAAQAKAALMQLASPEKARFLAGFFKTGKGQYAEGDRFLGIPVPAVRGVAKEFRSLTIDACEELLRSEFNDIRFLALVVLAHQYEKGGEEVRERIFQSYLNHRQFVNNWNLVDGSAPYIFGAHLVKRDRALLYGLARSPSLWDRRIAIVATLAFIRQNDLTDTFEITRLLLTDRHDLIHKACGWMLREAGKRSQPALEAFLKELGPRMPRTMLRYAIERFPADARKAYLAAPRGGTR